MNETLLALGGDHTGLLLEDHSIRLFGDDSDGQVSRIPTDVKFNVISLALGG